MAGVGDRLCRRPERQDAQPRPAGQGSAEFPQRRFGLPGLHALSRGADDRPLSRPRPACSSTTPICRTRSCAWPRCCEPAGYATAYIGKWHLDGHGRESYIPPERRQGWEYWKAAECDHTYNHSHYYTGNSDEKRFWDGYDAFAQTKDAQQYLRDHARGDQPFVLMVAYGVPHFPHAHRAGGIQGALSAGEDPAAAQRARRRCRPRRGRKRRAITPTARRWTSASATCWRRWPKPGIAENTIVVFTSDHGEMLGSHGCPPIDEAGAWNESAHVPFLLRYPAIHGSQGRVVDTPLTTPDILPDAAGPGRRGRARERRGRGPVRP